MKLLTAEIEKRLAKHPLGSQIGKGDNAEIIVKFFGGGSATWLVTEGEQKDGDWIFFGKATLFGDEWEWGYFTLSELKELRFPPFGLPIERDMWLDKHAKVGDIVKEIW